jgi:hypothetical protein
MQYSLDLLTSKDSKHARGRKIASKLSFYKIGVLSDQFLICAVSSTALESTVKVFEIILGAKASTLGRTFGWIFGGDDTVRISKEFFIPTESTCVYFLRKNICIGCSKGFELVHLDSLHTQNLLDSTDSNLDFVVRKESAKALAIYRLTDGLFFICYNGSLLSLLNLEFGFFVGKNGRRERNNFLIRWIGNPSHFSFKYPYIFAFDGSFIEIRHLETGFLEQIISRNSVRCLNDNPSHIHFASETNDSQDVFMISDNNP